MRIFFSGNLSGESLPENLIPEKKPFVMLTFFEIFERNGSTKRRYKNHQDNAKLSKKKPR